MNLTDIYTYGYNRQRIRMEEYMGNTIHVKDYVGMCEYVTEADLGGTVSKSRTYLTGPYGVFVKNGQNPASQNGENRPLQVF